MRRAVADSSDASAAGSTQVRAASCPMRRTSRWGVGGHCSSDRLSRAIARERCATTNTTGLVSLGQISRLASQTETEGTSRTLPPFLAHSRPA